MHNSMGSDAENWYGPATGYERRAWLLMPTGAILRAYRLDEPGIGQRLLLGYKEIETEKHAMEWIKKMGLPAVDQDGRIDINLIPASAKSLRALLDVHDALKHFRATGDIIGLKNLLVINKVTVESLLEEFRSTLNREKNKELLPWWKEYSKEAKQQITAFRDGVCHVYSEQDYALDALELQRAHLDEAEKMRRLRELPLSSKLQRKRNIVGLSHAQKQIIKYLNKIEAALARKGQAYFEGTDKVFYATEEGLCSRPDIPEIVNPFKADHDDELATFAIDYLRRAANMMLKGVQPYLVSDENHKLILRYQMQCPWHAMATEFAARVSGKEIRVQQCRRDGCGKILENVSPEARACPDNEACKKWVQRNLPPIRKSNRGMKRQ